MFSYMGSKYRLSPKYGKPTHSLVIEPFAGSAAYSVYHEPRRVLLLDSNPIIAGIWTYLIRAKESEIGKLPLDFDSVDNLDVPQEAKWLIGFWITKGNVHPNKTRSAWARQYRHSGDCKVWSEAVRERLKTNVSKIRDWKVKCASYEVSPNKRATWFIDPPYKVAGRHYPHSQVDYEFLAEFCKSRKGQIIVCENAGATWLPFKPFAETRGVVKNSEEVAWCR